jgi:hypothetical protein
MDPVVLAPLLYAILYGYWGVGTWNLTIVKLLGFLATDAVYAIQKQLGTLCLGPWAPKDMVLYNCLTIP